MKIKKNHLIAFKKVIDKYAPGTKFPIRHNWKQLTNNELWLRLVTQIMVIGSSTGNDKFVKSSNLKKRIAFNTLMRLNNEEDLVTTINSVFRDAGVRFVNKDAKILSQKAKSLAKNFEFIKNYSGGFIGMIKYLKDFKGGTAELDRVYFLSKNLEFISHKSARDFLMTLGINFNTIAIDSRIQTIFKHVGLPIPKNYTQKTYEETEIAIVKGICEPLKIVPVKFDRILYKNYSQIKRMKFTS